MNVISSFRRISLNWLNPRTEKERYYLPSTTPVHSRIPPVESPYHFNHLHQSLPDILHDVILDIVRIRQPIVPSPVEIDGHANVAVVVDVRRLLNNSLAIFENNAEVLPSCLFFFVFFEEQYSENEAAENKRKCLFKPVHIFSNSPPNYGPCAPPFRA